MILSQVCPFSRKPAFSFLMWISLGDVTIHTGDVVVLLTDPSDLDCFSLKYAAASSPLPLHVAAITNPTAQLASRYGCCLSFLCSGWESSHLIALLPSSIMHGPNMGKRGSCFLDLVVGE